MLTDAWFESDEVRYGSILRAILGHYGIAHEHLLGGNSERARQVFVRLLVICRVSPDVIERQTAWNHKMVWHRIVAAREKSSLREQEKTVVRVLMRHLVTALDSDEEIPPDGEDLCKSWHRDRYVTALGRAHDERRRQFWGTEPGKRWSRTYRKMRYQPHHVLDIIVEKPGDHDRTGVEQWRELSANDVHIWQCFQHFAHPVTWGPHTVFIVRGYQTALQLSDKDCAEFEADGRVILTRGKSASCMAPPSAHCLVFVFSDEAREFLYAVCPPRKNRFVS